MAALIGPDGNDLPETMADGVSSYDFMAINGRALTEYQREAFNGNFGVGLPQAIHQERLSVGAIQHRLDKSFVGDPGYAGQESLEIAFGKGIYSVDLTLEARLIRFGQTLEDI